MGWEGRRRQPQRGLSSDSRMEDGMFWMNLQTEAERIMNHPMNEQPSAPINLTEDVGSPADPQDAAKPNRRTKGLATKTKLQNFSPEEDKTLVICWIGISCDPIVGNGQNREAFWQRVTNAYNNKRGMAPERTQKSVRSKWEAIKDQTMKFSSSFYQVHRINPSGMSDADKTTKAADRFAATWGYSFKFLHVWHLLKDEPVWMDIASQSQKAAEGVNDNNIGTDVNELDRESSPANSKEK